MALTADRLDRLRASHRDLAAHTEAFTTLFFDRLFAVAPEVEPLFRGDRLVQGTKLMNTLGTVVAQLHAIDALRPMLADLARRHVDYGVQPPHYDHVGDALLWSITRTVRPCPETAAAWAEAYAALAETMIAAASPDGRD